MDDNKNDIMPIPRFANWGKGDDENLEIHPTGDGVMEQQNSSILSDVKLLEWFNTLFIYYYYFIVQIFIFIIIQSRACIELWFHCS